MNPKTINKTSNTMTQLAHQKVHQLLLSRLYSPSQSINSNLKLPNNHITEIKKSVNPAINIHVFTSNQSNRDIPASLQSKVIPITIAATALPILIAVGQYVIGIQAP